jgi:hypothetical protein
MPVMVSNSSTTLLELIYEDLSGPGAGAETAETKENKEDF